MSDVSFGFKVLCFGFPLQPGSPDPVIISDSHRDALDDVAEIWWFYNKTFWPDCVDTKEKLLEQIKEQLECGFYDIEIKRSRETNG